MNSPRRTARTRRGSIAGTLLGILVFLAGVGLLALTFKLAIDMFSIEPAARFGLEKGKELDLNAVLAQLANVLVRVILLLVMAVIGGVIANRGIKMFADSRWAPSGRAPKREPVSGSSEG